ncbi:hypothetical protein [Blastococcus haudaquaticus]|uniref:Uncharacterized protein n=1 Tax=Blastococcus haudaquaticus TaxID=1938745 RepID=A0A286H942_9ACTN|nr:hypothetical protein [Blastococcus haudaquaticus]SOE03764.1 hypothetical protein SAMN06272739_4333 [Blastococcus haudaquaticus]
MRLVLTMETMHAAGRRTLPPVPRPSADSVAAAEDPGQPDNPTERFVVDLVDGESPATTASTAEASTAEDDVPDGAVDGGTPELSSASSPVSLGGDPAQEFVTRLRTAAADFAAAAGAESGVVREAVPPARHRRARCRVVLRYADESEVDLTFLGPAGRPGTPSRHGFDRQIRRWLQAGQHREEAWLVTDPDAPDGLAVDLSAWIAAA